MVVIQKQTTQYTKQPEANQDPVNGKLGVVMIADIPNDGDGGTLTVQLSGFQGAAIAVMDDPGDNPLSALNSTTGTGTLTYNWVACCTDGFVIIDAVQWRPVKD